MALRTLTKLCPRVHRLPYSPPFARSSSFFFSSAKVADKIVRLSAFDSEGKKHQILGLAGQTLLKSLINGGLIDPDSHRLEEIDACSSECEVRITKEWLEKLPPRSYDEAYILKKYSSDRLLNEHARLSCQVILNHDLEGMVVAVPEAKPWYIP